MSATTVILIYGIFAVILALCAIMLYRFSERNHSQKLFLFVILTWFVVVSSRITIFALNSFIPANHTTLQFQWLTMGMVCFWVFMIYPIYTLNPKLILSRPAIIYSSPVVVATLIYVVYHLAAGLPLAASYQLDTIAEYITTPTIILRLLIVATFIFMVVALLTSSWRLIGSYQQYIQRNFSNPRYNVSWLHLFTIGMGCISVAYFVNVFNMTLGTLIFYAVITSFVFIAIMDNAISHRSFELPEGYSVEWSFKRGWYWVDTTNHHYGEIDEVMGTISANFFSWIRLERPFCNPEFTSSNVKERFPLLDSTTLNTILATQGHNFQSFVRLCRIEEAIRIIETEGSETNHKSIAIRVGFSHYSSFCRAFSAVKGQSPSRFAKSEQTTNI